MQGQGKNIGSFPETIDVGQGSGSNGAGLSQQTSFNNLLAPVENRWSSFVSSGEACLNASNIGESTGSVMQNQVNDEGMKIEHGRSSSYSASRAFDPMSEERQFETTSILFPGRTIISLGGNQVRSGPSQGSSSNHIHQNVNLNVGNNSDCELGGASGGPNLYMSSGTETYQTSGATASSDIIGTSSGSSGFIVGDSNGASGSLSNWGLSGKRKALEGTSGQSSPGGSSSSFPQAENYAWHTGSARHNPSGSLRLSVPSCNSPTDSLTEQRNPRTGVASRTVTSFPSSSVTVNLESPLRQFGNEFETGSQQDSVPFNLTSSGDAMHSSFCSPHQSARPFTSIDSLDMRASSVVAANSAAPHIQSHISSFPGNMHPLSWNGASNSRVGSMSNSLPGERGTELREEANLRSIPRSNVEQSMFVSANELRSSAQDPTNSSLATGNISTSLGIPSSSSSSRIGSSSSTPSWIPPHNPPTQNRQRTLEFAPWSLFPSIDSQPGGRSGHLNPLLPGPSSSQDTTMSSGRNNHNRLPPSLRSSFLLDRQGEDVLSMSNSLRVLSADIEGRRRLISEIRQVLNAMRRGENLQAEDYMLFDPFIYHGMAEIHDRHRDMRLDVDNMSYEELLALEERIGDVSTGLTETTILKLMKQRKFASFGTESGSDIEPCCICQEEYADGDEVGALDCGHDFHTDCVKQWLMQKNLCPICKTTGLLT